jgi:hypothetical protein
MRFILDAAFVSCEYLVIATAHQRIAQMTTATIALLNQIATLREAVEKIENAIDHVTGSVNPGDATWRDVAILAQMVDAVKRADLVSVPARQEG